MAVGTHANLNVRIGALRRNSATASSYYCHWYSPFRKKALRDRNGRTPPTRLQNCPRRDRHVPVRSASKFAAAYPIDEKCTTWFRFRGCDAFWRRSLGAAIAPPDEAIVSLCVKTPARIKLPSVARTDHTLFRWQRTQRGTGSG